MNPWCPCSPAAGQGSAGMHPSRSSLPADVLEETDPGALAAGYRGLVVLAAKDSQAE